MPSCGRTLAEKEYIFSLEEIFRGRPVVESTFTHSIVTVVNDGRESTEQLHADRKLISKIQIFIEMQSNRQVSNNVPYFPLQWETTVARLVSPRKLELWRSVTILNRYVSVWLSSDGTSCTFVIGFTQMYSFPRCC